MGSGHRSSSVDIADTSTRARGSARVHAFDWLRIIAFGLLILFHAGQPYNPFYTWHVTDADKSNLLWDLVGWMRFWRLHLLFFVSGFGTYFALRKLDGVAFVRERSVRLWVHLLFGMAVVCPPQVWVERVTQHGYADGFLTFFVRDAFTHGTYPAGNITWNHLWFLPYLLLMTVVLTPLLVSLRDSGWLEATRFGAPTMRRSVALLSSVVILPILGHIPAADLAQSDERPVRSGDGLRSGQPISSRASSWPAFGRKCSRSCSERAGSFSAWYRCATPSSKAA